VIRALLLAALLGAGAAAHAADVPGLVTILDGDALVYRGTGRLQAAEGVRLAAGDIVHTGPGAFMQVELPGDAVAQLGPDTQLMLAPVAARMPERSLYLLSGWVKLTRPAAAGFELRSPWADLPPADSVLVLQSTPAQQRLFVERGEVKLVERGAGAADAPVLLKATQTYLRKPGVPGQPNAPGVMAGIVKDMPPGYRDTLPRRAAKWKDKPVSPRPAPDFAYADVEPWLKAEVPLRKPLVRQWRAKARDAAFRSALIANLPAHPEWDPILFPEKYLPKPASSAARNTQAATTR
jgi:hypothetical protein